MAFRRAAILGLALLSAACTVTLTVRATLYTRPTRAVRVTQAPPPVRADRPATPQPTSDAVWVEGHWAWTGSQWEWVPGAWKEPRPGHVWEPPVCVADGDDYDYWPGYFHPEEESPEPSYREPGNIQLHAPSQVGIESATVPNLPERVLVTDGVLDSAGANAVDAAEGAVDGVSQVAGAGQDAVTSGGENLPCTGEDCVPEVERPDVPATPSAEAPESPEVPALACRLTITTVPRAGGGNFAISGAGFVQEGMEVKVGGNIASIRLITPTEIQARTDNSGPVTITRGDDSADCGTLTLQ